jgi:hypothetical protein
MVTLLLAVVAIAARGRPLGSRAGSGGALPFSFWDYVYTTIVIVVVPLFLAGLFAAAFIRRGSGKKRSSWQSLLRMLVFYACLLGVELLVVRYLHLHRPKPSDTVEPDLLKSGHRHAHHGRGGGSNSLQFRWDELAILLGFIVVVGVILGTKLYRANSQREPDQAAPEALAAALDESLDELGADGDLRQAIILAYARMEAALAAAGIRRRPAQTPLEFVEQALLSLDTSAAAVRRLTELYEWARFSHHEPEPSMRDDAVDALAAVRDELRAAELTPA